MSLMTDLPRSVFSLLTTQLGAGKLQTVQTLLLPAGLWAPWVIY